MEPNEYRSFNSINNICVNLHKQYFSDEDFPERSAKTAIYEMLYPLIRYGLIEFYSNNKYGLSPSCALYSDSNVLTCNIPFALYEEVIDKCIFDNYLGIKVFEKSMFHITFFKENFIPYSKFAFSDHLKMISLEKIINSWKDDTVIDSNNYFFFNYNNTWSNTLQKTPKGVFKKSREVYAQRTLKLSENKWKCIPARENNIDSFNIAAIWGQIQNSWDIKIKYHAKETKLVVKNIYFPIVIERILFFNTLLDRHDFDVFNREYLIKQKEFHILNELFDNKIQII